MIDSPGLFRVVLRASCPQRGGGAYAETALATFLVQCVPHVRVAFRGIRVCPRPTWKPPPPL
jgi:hypothetical protein